MWRSLGLPLVAFLLAVSVTPASARDLFGQPGIGITTTKPPRVTPELPGTTVPGFQGNQCQLMAGTCPLGRLQRSGSRCYCRSDGSVRQGGAQKRKQGG